MSKQDIRNAERQQSLLKIFLDIVKEDMITVKDVREIIEIGYEIFKSKRRIRSNGNNIQGYSDKSKK